MICKTCNEPANVIIDLPRALSYHIILCWVKQQGFEVNQTYNSKTCLLRTSSLGWSITVSNRSRYVEIATLYNSYNDFSYNVSSTFHHDDMHSFTNAALKFKALVIKHILL